MAFITIPAPLFAVGDTVAFRYLNYRFIGEIESLFWNHTDGYWEYVTVDCDGDVLETVAESSLTKCFEPVLKTAENFAA